MYNNSKIIYLADDDQDDRFFISEAIKKFNPEITIIEVENGVELLSMMQEENNPPGLVLVDMNMPKMNGLETVSAIRNSPGFSFIPAVMLSTSSDPSLISLAYEAGVNSFFIKPTSLEGFIDLALQLACYLL